jgi:multiple antibiotic resistance protein
MLIGLTLWLSVPITRLVGKTGIKVATRVMSLVAASIGVHFILTGLKNQFPGLAHP